MLTLKSDATGEIFYATEYSAGFDIRANEDASLKPGEFCPIATGLSIVEHESAVEIAYGSKKVLAIPELQIRPRSGLAAKNGVTVLNSPGTIDADYRGEIKIILINHSKETFEIRKGDRIAQGICSLALHLPRVQIQALQRGTNGFGSTGKN